MPHRTEVMGFMTILHGDDRFYNNIFVQKYSRDDFVVQSDSRPEEKMTENRKAGTDVWDEYPTYAEWMKQFDMEEEVPNMAKLEGAHQSHLPVWCDGNAYFGGARAWKHERRKLTDEKSPVYVELVEKAGYYTLDTNVYDLLGDFTCGMIDTGTLGKAFEPDEPFENPDGTPITFNYDYLGNHRGIKVLPGPFSDRENAGRQIW